ncbi:Fungal specific transcription factor domain containing protein [Naviculisporaceae sp. PSN 640]
MSASDQSSMIGNTASTGPSSTANPKQRSCVTCRARKVKCNKASPCNHCQRAGIACLFPTPDRTPRWARRLNQQALKDVANKPSFAPTPRSQNSAEGVAPVMDRLHKLESLVRELSSQLRQEQQQQTTGSTTDTTLTTPSPPAVNQGSDGDKGALRSDPGSAQSVQQEFGRLVLDDSRTTRYVSSGFWSRIKDELDSLRIETGALAEEESDLSEEHEVQEESQPTYSSEQAALERGSFLFGSTLTASSTEELHPSPTQIPLMLAIFTRNVNVLIQVVHMPTVMKIVQTRHEKPSHANDALLFAIYYATIASMEEEDVTNMLGGSRQVLLQKYRVGVEQCLAKADFLNASDLVLVQALATFLLLLRRAESPRYVWMMTGLVIRMAMALGLHRDGAKLRHLSPYEMEIRRRVWWVVLGLDLRSSEDQGVDLTIPHNSFDTQVPLSINDLDLEPESKEMPVARTGFTDMTFALYSINTCRWTRETFRPNNGLVDIEKRLNDFYNDTNENFLKLALELPDMSHWIGYMVLRLVIAKMTLILYMPELFSTPPEDLPPDFRTKLFMSALEVAEINYALNAEPKARHWRWMVQTYTQWHAIVILLIEISRRPWSPTIERAWTALQSKWLIPSQSSMNRSLRVWIPLRRLIAQAKRHRIKEIERLRQDPAAARALEEEDARTLIPPRGGGTYEPTVAAMHRDRWRILVGTPGTGPRGEGAADIPPVEPIPQYSGMEHLTTTSFLPGFEESKKGGQVSYRESVNPHVVPETQGATPAPEFQPLQLPGQVYPSPGSSTVVVGDQGQHQQQQQDTYINNIPQAHGPTSLAADPGTASFDPWLWADPPMNDPASTGVFNSAVALDGVDLSGDMDMQDMYSRVDWMDWLGTARDVETGKVSDGSVDDSWGMGSSGM